MLITDKKPAIQESCMADLEAMHTPRTLVGMHYDSRGVTLTWDDGCHSRLHALWLRDNCACADCRHPQALERMFMFVDHAAPLIISASLEGDEALVVQFQADDEIHVSRYTKGWLRTHDLLEIAARARQVAPMLWNADMSDRLPSVDYADYMQSNAGLRAWIHALTTYGIVLLREVPREPGKLLDVAHRIGPVRASNFGEYYDVVSMLNPNASAYTPIGLELHTDLANWRTPPDVQLLFCLQSSVIGGESVFADGFKVAEDLRIGDPAAFHLLCTHPIEHRFHDDGSDIRSNMPLIEVDREGKLTRIRFNNWLRAATAMPDSEVETVYGAIAKFWRMLRDPTYRLNLRLEPGWLIAYNNNRVLHGRTPFDASTGERHLQGCYLNQEDVESALRILDRQRTPTPTSY